MKKTVKISSLIFRVALLIGLILCEVHLAGQTSSQTFNTPGSHTFTVPPGVTSITVEAWGGGGGGGGSNVSGSGGSGGGGGGYSSSDFVVTPGQTVDITVGNGGTAGAAAGGTGGNGGTTNVTYGATTINANGGSGGGGNAGTPGSGGTASGGTTNTTGGDGEQGGSSGGDGGDVANGGVGGNGGLNGVGQPGTAPGGGGGGGERAFFGARAGGSGAAGRVRISWTGGTYTTSGTFTVPTDVNLIIVECWGGGGGGSTRTNDGVGGGGGGGAYASSAIPVTPGNTYSVVVGTGGTAGNPGGNSSFNTSVVVAAGGGGVANNTAAGASGGTVSASTGTIRYAGGTGGTGAGNNSGGGGGGAGSNGNGGDASGVTGGSGTSQNGGNGANGVTTDNTNGLPGQNYGGGGSGSRRNNGTRIGGTGANGLVIITIPIYYSYGNQDPNNVNNWWTNTNGTGAHPANFTSGYQRFIIQNGHTYTTVAGGWNVSGTSTTVQIQNGGTLTENNNITLSPNTTLQIDNGGTLNHNVNSLTIFGGTESIDPASTINYGFAGIQAIPAFNYGNLIISGSGVKTVQGSIDASSLTINGVNPEFYLGSTFSHNITGSFVMSNGSVNGGSSTLRLGGSVNVTGGSLTPGTGTFELYGGPQSVPAFTYYNLTLSGGSLKTLTGNTRVNGVLNLNTVVLATGLNNLTLGAGASINGTFASSNMIDIGGGTLIREGNSNSDFALTLPIGIGSDYTPVQISSFNATTIFPASTIRIQSFASPASGVQGSRPLNRHWITSTTGISGSVLADISFQYVLSDIPSGGTQGLYEITYKPASGTWGKPGGASAAGANPIRASATTSLDATWTASEPEKRIFYSYKTGNWDDPATWTLDPSGTLWLNPNSYTPVSSPTASSDEVIILPGRTVTITGNNLSNMHLTVNGTLDMGLTTGHSFTTISGSGRIRLAGDNFPAGDASDFIKEGMGEGTVEYYGSTRNLTASRTFFNMDVTMTPGQTLYLVTDYVLNGNLTVSNGILSFNNNASASSRNVTVHGTMSVEPNGQIGTGTANARHQLNLYGDFINNGEARFTNRTVPDYVNQATNGITDVNFLNPSVNQSITCNGLTNFYRIEIDKGTDFTYLLNIDATNPDFFKLLGYSNESHGSVPQLGANNNSLGLLRGTVRIGNNVIIPVLSQNSGNYNISESAQIWIDGGTISKNTGTAIVVYGKIRMTAGTLEARINSGITFRENGLISVEGGTINANQIRTTTEGSSTYGGYVQTGGTVNVVGEVTNNDFYVFSLPFPSSVFNMSGGILKVNTAGSNGNILINSAPENIKVTGGTVIAETQSTRDFRITSTAPFWNLEFQNPTGSARQFLLTAADNIGPADVDIPAQPLKVLNDFRIWGQESGGTSYAGITFNPGINDVYIGGSFFIEDGAHYIPIIGGTAPYDAISNQPTSRNTTYLNQTAGTGNVEELYNGNDANPLEFGNLVIERTSGYEVRLTSSTSRLNESIVLDINGNASVLSGTLNQNLFTIRTWGSIVNNDRMGTWFPGVTPSKAQVQFVENPALTLSTATGAVFGNIQVNVTPPFVLSLSSDVFIERLEYVKGLIYLKSFNLKIDNLWNMDQGLFENSSANSFLKVADAGHSGNSLIFTDGKASDGGLSLKISANSQIENQPNILNNTGPTTFPVGFTTDGGTTRYFRPAQMVVKDFADDGYVTVHPVMGPLSTLNPAGGEVLQQFWRVSSEEFNTPPTVSFRFYYRNRTGSGLMDLLVVNSPNENNYVPGKVKDGNPYTRLYEPLGENDILKNIGPTNTRVITFNGTGNNGLFTPSSPGFTLENTNFTAGSAACFAGAPTHYYSNASYQEWNNANTWDVNFVGSGIHAVPTTGSIVHIYNNTSDPATSQGRISVNASGIPNPPAEIIFEMPNLDPSLSNPENVPRLQFWRNGTYNLGFVRGTGMISFGNTAVVTNGDFGDFGTNPYSYYLFFGGPAQLTSIPAPIPNMMIEYSTNINQNIVINYDLIIQGNAVVQPLQNIEIKRDLVLGFWMGSNFQFPATGSPVQVTVGRDIDFTRVPIAGAIGNRVLSTSGSAGTLEHRLILKRSIIHGNNNNFTIDLYGSAARSKAILELQGTENASYNRSSASVPQFYRIVMNKGDSQLPSFTFNNDFSLLGSTNTAVKAINMVNGTLILNSPTLDLNLTTGGSHFEIPGTSVLNVAQGIVRANGNSGISLDGKLLVNGGEVNMSGGDNPIEYSASGNATISVSSGTLTVGGQVRRSMTSDVGILQYTQSGGTVVVGNNSATVGHRGVFEILNPGSSFTMTGGDLFIARSQTSPAISAFYFDPDNYNIGANGNIHIGHSTTPASQTIGIYALKPLPRLRINGSGTLNPKVTARLEIVPATIQNLLQIDAGTFFNANGLNLTLSGDMIASGTFIPGCNTTYFNGTGLQTIAGNGSSISFHNLDKTGSNNLALSAGNTPVLVSNSLFLRGGTLTDNGNSITVKGNVLNNAVHDHNGSGDGIVLNGDLPQDLTGDGTFGKLTINNPLGANIPVGNELSITRFLKLQSGVLNIGSNLLSLGVDALIEEASPFSSANMIVTNLSFTDNGLKKTFRSGSSPIFTFPIGSNNKYTPVTLLISANGNSSGSLTVRPANEMHPGIVEDTEVPGPQIVDKDNALQHYWTLTAEGITGFSALARMYYNDEDVKVTAPYDIDDYHTATLLSSGSGTWLKFPQTTFDETNKRLEFNFTGNDDSQISGDYTAGAGDASLDGAIPSTVSNYETTGSGDWVSDPIWSPSVTGGPRGAIVKINAPHTVDVSSNYRSVYKSDIDGILRLNSTFGHRLGIVEGSGTIYLEIGSMPAAIYNSFFQPTGGTLEFGGTTNYEFLGNITGINHLKLSGSGQRQFPNNNLSLNGDLIIDGQPGLQVFNSFGRTIQIRGNLSRIAGSFDAGSGANAAIVFRGSGPQVVTGSFIDNNAFNILEINNFNGVTFTGEAETDRELRLTDGLVNVNTGTPFRLNFSSSIMPVSGSPASFVNGTLIKELLNGNSFTFAIGSQNGSAKNHGPIRLVSVAGAAGINDWEATYYYEDAATAGYSTLSYQTPITTVSKSEYWKMEGPAGGSARISISLDGSSDVASSLPDLSNLRIAGWNVTDSKWEIVGTGATVTGTATSGTITTTSSVQFDNYSFFTLASVIPVIPNTATITSPSSVTICSGASTTITVAFTGAMPYSLTYTAGSTTVTIPVINTPTRDITVNPATTTVYTLTSMTADGVSGLITGTSSVTVTVNPLPTVNLSRLGSGDICPGNSITFTATAGLSNYNFRVNSISVQNGPSNTFTTTTLVPGTHTVDVVGTNAAGCSTTSNPIGVTVDPLPGAASPISGPASVCRTSTHTFTIPAIADAASYNWTVTGVGATGSSTTNSITLTFPTAGVAIITVRGVNSCGNGTPSVFNVSVNTASTPGAAGAITGPAQVCRGGTGYTYSVNPVANATSYIWQYTGTGATINGTGNTVTIDFAPGATNGNLRVRGTNGCANGNWSPNFAVNTNQPPTATINPALPSICSGSSLSLTAAPAGGTAPYTIHSWSGTGAVYLSSTSIPNPVFNSPNGGVYTLVYSVTDSRGCIGTANVNVTVYNAPIADAGTDISGLCSGTSPVIMTGATATGSYTGIPTWSGAGGTWTQNPDPSLATFTPSTPSGSTVATLTLTGANGCSNVTDTRLISWNGIPGQPGSFTVSKSVVCQGQSGIIYTIPSDPMATSYTWTYTVGSGVTINGTGTSVTLDFSAAATSGNLNVTATNSCGTSSPRSISITVNVPPVASFNYPLSPYCPTASDPFPVFSGGGVAGTFTASPVGLVFINSSTGQVDLSASVPGVYTVTNTISAGGGCGDVYAENTIEITGDFIWTGLSGSEWNVSGNWSCGIVPGSINSITIPDVANDPVITVAETGIVNNLTIASGAVLTVEGTIRVGGSVTNGGSFDISDGTIELNGTSLQTLNNGLAKYLIINNSSGVSLTGPFSVTGTVLLQSGNLASDGNLTLISNAAGTALIDGSGTGNVTGNVTMQRYLPSGFGYKYFSSPFQAATVEQFEDDMDLGSAFTPFYRYDENRLVGGVPASGWVRYHNPTTNPLVPLAGYSVNFGSISDPNTADITGVVNNGNLSVTLYNHNQTYTKGFNLVGNPYPSPIDWNAGGWTKTNIDNALYFFKASTTDQYGGTYSTYINGVSTGGATNVIASMQGFFVHVSDGAYPVTATLGVTNSVRVTNSSPAFFKKSATMESETRSLINLSAGFSADESVYDPLVVYLDDKASGNFDSDADALKLSNTDYGVPNFYSFGDDGKQMSINAMPSFEDGMQPLPLGLVTRKNGEIVFRLREMTGIFKNSEIYLLDSIAGIRTRLADDMEYRTVLSMGTYNNRFYLSFEDIITNVNTLTEAEPVSIYSSGNRVFADIRELAGKSGTLTIYNVSGLAVFNTKIYDKGHYDFYPQVMDGMYIAVFVSGKLRATQKIFITAR